MNNLALLAVTLSALTLIGCKSTPISNPYIGETVTITTELGYSKAVACALDNIDTPTTDNFFSYESDEQEKYSVTFYGDGLKFRPSEPFSLVRDYETKATLKASYTDGVLTYKLTKVMGKYTSYSSLADEEMVSKWEGKVPQRLVDHNRVSFGRLMAQLTQCTKTI
ncbi:hypothetical protein [Shewanella sp. UCD-KL12]|uniref:hypothetical protein n=1 Tax=Shewanella sp. UCD-KL12 TaxID=1917163 RepID=UPI000971210A|nr:hypothetical protein [Shewanella sp. UCD-KL12]